MNFSQIADQLLHDLSHTTWYEYLAVISGILSVWLGTRERILYYPIGLINTLTYIYISIEGHLIGEASVNIYYTIMSIIGWINWAKKDARNQKVLQISYSNQKEWIQQIIFFLFFYTCIYFCLIYFKTYFLQGVIPWADALASASAFTGMWLINKKKMENWYWWALTNVVSVPLYFVKHYVFSSFYFLVLLILCFFGWRSWKKKIHAS
jgi:nicotinamide mononucleotide transporter